ERRESRGERAQRLGVERSTLEPPIEPRVVRELAHLDGVLDRRLSADARGFRIPADRHDAQVELRREPPIEPQLFPAEVPPAIERAEVEEWKFDGLLDLVGVRAGQEYPRDVRLGDADRVDFVIVSVGPL